jgi:hypothetical protein
MRLQPDDGFEVVDRIHRLKPLVPIFMVASDPTSVAVNRAFDMGVADFITKPYVTEVLVAKLQKEINAQEHKGASAAQAGLASKDQAERTYSAEEIAAGVVIEVEQPEQTPGPAGKQGDTDPGQGTSPGTSPGSSPGTGSFSSVGGTKSMLSGSLEGKTALALIKALVNKKRTGKLGLRIGDKRGEIFFQGGQVFRAAFDQTEGEEAFLEMAAWKDCVYQFDPAEGPASREIKTPTPQLLQIASMSLGT